jgi:signal transduction histidine kinase/ActR/RegA family two-component response regulator
MGPFALSRRPRARRARSDPTWLRQAYQHEQLRLLELRVRRIPAPVIVSVLFVAAFAWRSSPVSVVVGWVLAVITCLAVRARLLAAAAAAPAAEIRRGNRRMVLTTMPIGIALGAAATLFFTHLDVYGRAFVTIVAIGWLAGGPATSIGHARAFLAFTVPITLQLVVMWTVADRLIGLAIGAMLLLFFAVQAMYTRDAARTLLQSLSQRYRNRRLVQKLAKARDEAQLATAAKSLFLAAASHDLRQPLSALALHSAALSRRKGDARVEHIAAKMDECITSMGALLGALLDISQLDANTLPVRPQAVRLSDICSGLESEVKGTIGDRRLHLRVTCEPDLWVHTDREQLKRLVRNVLDNAVKYTREGTVTLSAHREESLAVLSVSDTGPGIPRDKHEAVFQEFVQLHNPERDRRRGLGLGLAIVRRLAQLLDAGLRFESEVGRGTTVAITLPAAQRPLGPPPEPREKQLSISGWSVLVLDDEADVREAMRTLLEELGCRVLLAGEPREALAAATAQRPDLVLADLRLRDHQSGIDAVGQIRRQCGNVPALLVTGDIAADRLREVAASGLPRRSKPLTEQELLAGIAEAVERCGAGAAESVVCQAS